MSDVKVSVPVDAFFYNRFPDEHRGYFLNNIPGNVQNMCYSCITFF